GGYNAGDGYEALWVNTTGQYNSALGFGSLQANTTGFGNTALGFQTLFANVDGTYNIAIGFDSGYYATSGARNIHIGYVGTAGDTGTIRIGEPNFQTAFFVTGVYGATASGGVPVLINSNGQLGTASS